MRRTPKKAETFKSAKPYIHRLSAINQPLQVQFCWHIKVHCNTQQLPVHKRTGSRTRERRIHQVEINLVLETKATTAPTTKKKPSQSAIIHTPAVSSPEPVPRWTTKFRKFRVLFRKIKHFFAHDALHCVCVRARILFKRYHHLHPPQSASKKVKSCTISKWFIFFPAEKVQRACSQWPCLFFSPDRWTPGRISLVTLAGRHLTWLPQSVPFYLFLLGPDWRKKVTLIRRKKMQLACPSELTLWFMYCSNVSRRAFFPFEKKTAREKVWGDALHFMGCSFRVQDELSTFKGVFRALQKMKIYQLKY